MTRSGHERRPRRRRAPRWASRSPASRRPAAARRCERHRPGARDDVASGTPLFPLTAGRRVSGSLGRHFDRVYRHALDAGAARRGFYPGRGCFGRGRCRCVQRRRGRPDPVQEGHRRGRRGRRVHGSDHGASRQGHGGQVRRLATRTRPRLSSNTRSRSPRSSPTSWVPSRPSSKSTPTRSRPRLATATAAYLH